MVQESENIDVVLNYNNSGNPSSSAYLDYISLKGSSALSFNGSQLIFYNDDLETEAEVVTYQISNSENINSIFFSFAVSVKQLITVWDESENGKTRPSDSVLSSTPFSLNHHTVSS